MIRTILNVNTTRRKHANTQDSFLFTEKRVLRHLPSTTDQSRIQINIVFQKRFWFFFALCQRHSSLK